MKYGTLSQGDVESDGSLFFQLAVGDTASRPSEPSEGMIRYNTELEASNVGEFSGLGRYEAYIDGRWTPIISMIDFVDPADLFSSGNVTLKVLADMIRDFFVQGMGMIEINQNQIFKFGTSADQADAVTSNKFYDPMGVADGVVAKVNTPTYMTNVNTTGSRPAGVTFQDGGLLNNRLVQQIQPLFEPVIGDGMIHTVNLISGGSGYTSPPKIKINTGGGDGAVGKLVVDQNATSPTYGQIIDAIIEEQGEGYRSGPYVKAYLKGGGGTGAEISCNVQNGRLMSLNIDNPGANYTSAPTLTFADGGTRGFISCEVVGGQVTNLRILSRGIDYSNVPGYKPTIEFVTEEPGVTPAEATITLGDNKLIEVRVLRGGSGFDPGNIPPVIVTGNASLSARCEVEASQLEGGVVTGVTIKDNGDGYDINDPNLAVTIPPQYTTSNSVVQASNNAIDFVFNFDFDIFLACGVPDSQRANYKLGLFTSVYKILPHYGHDGYGQQFYQSVSLIPKWDTSLTLENQANHADYGKYTGNMTLQGQRAYYMAACGAIWFGNLTKFRGF